NETAKPKLNCWRAVSGSVVITGIRSCLPNALSSGTICAVFDSPKTVASGIGSREKLRSPPPKIPRKASNVNRLKSPPILKLWRPIWRLKLIRPTLRDDVDVAAARAPEFGVEVAAVDLELLDRLLADGRAHAVGRDVVVVHAVNRHAVGAPILPGEIELRGRNLPRQVVGESRILFHHAGREQREAQEIAPVDRQVLNRLFSQRVGLLRALGLDYRGLAADDFNLSRDLPDLQVEINDHRLAHGERD